MSSGLTLIIAVLAYWLGFSVARGTFPWDDRREAAGQDYRDGYEDGRRSVERYP